MSKPQIGLAAVLAVIALACIIAVKYPPHFQQPLASPSTQSTPSGSTSESTGTRDSLSVEVTPAIPRIEFSFASSGEKRQRVKSSVAPKDIELEPLPTLVKEEDLPKEVKVEGGTITVLRLGAGFMLFDTSSVPPGTTVRGRIISYDRLRSAPAKKSAAGASQTCPNGICIGGDNNGSASVTNYNGVYPPPNVVPTITICTTNPSPAIGQDLHTVLTLKTDTAISQPSWWFLFDGPVLDASVEASVDGKAYVVGYAHDHPPREKRPLDWQNAIGVTITALGGMFSQLPWRPDINLAVIVTSKNPVNLIEIHGRSLDQSLEENFALKCE